MDYTTMSYKDLDAAWYELDRARNIACGTPKATELTEEMEEVKKWMAVREAEWNTPERRAKAQKIGL